MLNRIVIYLFLIFTVSFSQDVLSQTAVKEFIDSVPLSTNMTIAINSKKSNLEIIRWERPLLWLKVRISFANEDLSVARREIEYSKFNLTKTTTGINLFNFFTLPEGTDRIQSVINIDYKIYIPDKITLIINNEYGICRLSNLSGYINLNNKYGEIYLNKMSGKTRIYSSLCDIHAYNISGNTEVNATNSNVFMKNINGGIVINNKVGLIHFESGIALNKLKIVAAHCNVDILVSDIKRFNYNLSVKNATIEIGEKFNEIPFSVKTKESFYFRSPDKQHSIEVLSSYNNIKLH